MWTMKKNRKPKPIEEFLKPQGRFKHMFKPGNEHLIEEFQINVDRRYAYIEAQCETSARYQEILEEKGLPLISDPALAMQSGSKETFQM